MELVTLYANLGDYVTALATVWTDNGQLVFCEDILVAIVDTPPTYRR